LKETQDNNSSLLFADNNKIPVIKTRAHVYLHSNCSSLTDSMSWSGSQYQRIYHPYQNIIQQKRSLHANKRHCKAFIISTHISEELGANEDWLVLVVGNYTCFRNFLMQKKSYFKDGIEKTFPIRFCFMHYAVCI